VATPISGCRHWAVTFDKDGTLISHDGLADAGGADLPADLVVFSHGWNTSEASARELSTAMFDLIAPKVPENRRASLGFVTVLWPSLLFPEDEPALDGPVIAAAGDAQSVDDPPPAMLDAAVSSGAALAEALAPAFPGQENDLKRIGELLDERPQDGDRLVEFHRLVSGLVTTPSDAPEDAGEDAARREPTRRTLETMAQLAPGRAGDAQALGLFDKLWDGARELARALSYYEMKNRAGHIGRVGLARLLDGLQGRRADLRVHLAGHSFGARLVAFALAGLPPEKPTLVRSMLLIQGAFSHFAFADPMPIDAARTGALAAVRKRVDGPLLATFSKADRAVGWWYPNASLLSREDNQAAHQFGYRWGGMGADGFQQDPAADQRLEADGHPYAWQAGTFYRVEAHHVINRNLSFFAGAHSDIRKPEIAWAAVTAAGLA
jgi:hypothetical protein